MPSGVLLVPSSRNCHGEAWYVPRMGTHAADTMLVASSRNCHGDADCGHKKTLPAEADRVKRLIGFGLFEAVCNVIQCIGHCWPVHIQSTMYYCGIARFIFMGIP